MMVSPAEVNVMSTLLADPVFNALGTPWNDTRTSVAVADTETDPPRLGEKSVHTPARGIHVRY